LQGREEAFDGARSLVTLSRGSVRKQEMLQRQHEEFVQSFTTITVDQERKLNASFEDSRKSWEQLQKDLKATSCQQVEMLKASFSSTILETFQESRGSIEHTVQLTSKQQWEKLEEKVIQLLEVNSSGILKRTEEQFKLELEEQKKALKRNHEEILQHQQKEFTKHLSDMREEFEVESMDTVKVNRSYSSASIRDLMAPYLLSLPFSHEFSHESNTGTSAPMMVLLDSCDLPALKVVSIGSLSPKYASYLHPIHSECTSTVNSIISEVCKCYEKEPYQVCSITFVKCADRVYLCQLLIAIIPNIITKDATLEADILYSLARVPLTSQLKSKVKSLQETLYKPKWYSRSSNSWLSGFKFEELPKMLHPISEQLELQTVRELKNIVKTVVGCLTHV
jgi:hypothetical protein